MSLITKDGHTFGVDADADAEVCRQWRLWMMDEIRKGERESKKKMEMNRKIQEEKQLRIKLPSMVAAIWSDDVSAQLQNTIQFQELLSIKQRCPLIEQAIKAHFVPRLVQFLPREEFPALQFEAARALTNLACGSSEDIKLVIHHGAIPFFQKLLHSPTENVRVQAVRALGIVAGYSPECRDLILDHGSLFPLLAQVLNEHATLCMLINASWALKFFCKGVSHRQVKLALPALARLIRSNNDEVVSNACWALSFLSGDGTNDKIQLVVQAGICQILVELLFDCPPPSILIPALETIAIIVAGDDNQTQCIISCQVLPCLHKLLMSEYKQSIEKVACLIISNITAGNTEQIQDVIDAGLFPVLMHLLENAGFDTKKEVVWAVSNATSCGTLKQISFLVGEGWIKSLCDLLLCRDSEIVTVCLESLENILKAGEAEKEVLILDDNKYAGFIENEGGLLKMKILCSHDNIEIREKAVKIVETYWSRNKNDTAPTGDASQPGLYPMSRYMCSRSGTYKMIT